VQNGSRKPNDIIMCEVQKHKPVIIRAAKYRRAPF